MSESVVFCPHCGGRFVGPEALLSDEAVVILCGLCRQASKVADLSVEPDREAPEEAPTVGPRVVVGHEQPGASRTLARVLRAGGYDPVLVGTGDLVLQACDPALPAGVHAVLLDVAIPGVLAFEVVQQLKDHPATQDVPIVLLASVFEKTRYKRQPNQLYGANAYLELHHVPDRLLPLLAALEGGEEFSDVHRQSPSERAAAAPFRTRVQVSSEEGRRIYARRLLSDIALYHGQEIDQGIRSDDPLQHVQGAVEEARTAYLAAAPGPTAARTFDEELASFRDRLAERRRARGQSH